MKDTFYTFVLIALIATGFAIWTVGFSRRWNDNAKAYLAKWFGEGPNDDELSEESRQFAAKLWLCIATIAWIIAGMAFRNY